MAPAVPDPVELVLFPALDQAVPAPGLPRACRTDQDATKFIPKRGCRISKYFCWAAALLSAQNGIEISYGSDAIL